MKTLSHGHKRTFLKKTATTTKLGKGEGGEEDKNIKAEKWEG